MSEGLTRAAPSTDIGISIGPIQTFSGGIEIGKFSFKKVWSVKKAHL